MAHRVAPRGSSVMASSGRKVDRRPGKKAASRSGYRFVGAEDASKLALVLERVRAGDVPNARELDDLHFESATARDAAAELVKHVARSGAEGRPARRRVAAG